MKHIKLSHSAIDLYTQCPMAYKLKYIDKYRETTTSSALTFGSAVGTTLQMMILDKKEVLTEEEKNIVGSNPYEFFDGLFSTTNINGVEINLPNSPHCFYFKGDWQEEILTEYDKEVLETYRTENGFLPEHTFNVLYGELKEGKATEAEKSFLALHFWISLRRKAHFMIKAFQDDIYPKIKKVYEIEGEIELKNNQGDIIRGFLDILCDYEVEKDVIKKVIIDLKTSSSKYPKDKLDESQQLNFYDYDREVGYIGYIIALKKIKKPKIGKRKGETFAEFQEMFREIDENIQEEVIVVADQILFKIKNEEFPKCEDKCMRFFGKRCPFYDICHNGDDSGLFKKEK